jgi:hypothetical protein
LTAGVYRISAAQLTGQLTLDLEEDPEGVFIFQIESTLITASDSSVIFVNGSSPCNVYWQVGSSATLGTGTDFIGNIMASASITMTTGATLDGRALAQTGSVTLDTNTITEPDCATPTDNPTDQPTDGPGGPGGTDGPDGPGGTDGPDGPGGTDGPGGPGGTDGPGGPGGTDGPGGPGGTDGPDGPGGTDGSGGSGGGPGGSASNASDDDASSDATDSAAGSGSGEGLPTTGSGTLMTVATIGLALVASGGLLATSAWRRARQD